MEVVREHAKLLLETYGRAWVLQDPELIATIFTADATYEDPHEPLCNGIEAIKEYWRQKVVQEQKDISFTLLNQWIEGATIIAEWRAVFTDVKNNCKVELKEVAIFTVKDGLFSSLREYYKSHKTPL